MVQISGINKVCFKVRILYEGSDMSHDVSQICYGLINEINWAVI